jgi:hypothetical protein
VKITFDPDNAQDREAVLAFLGETPATPAASTGAETAGALTPQPSKRTRRSSAEVAAEKAAKEAETKAQTPAVTPAAEPVAEDDLFDDTPAAPALTAEELRGILKTFATTHKGADGAVNVGANQQKVKELMLSVAKATVFADIKEEHYAALVAAVKKLG